MRPGEIILADLPAPTAEHPRTETVEIHNSGRFPAYLTSHFRLERASAALVLDRERVAGARPLVAAGSSVRIGPGETIEVTVTWN